MTFEDNHFDAISMATSDPCHFALLGGIKLRHYQETVALEVARSVEKSLGLSFVVMFPRQSGKNELQAQLEAYFLMRYSFIGGELVKISPTWKPQSQNALRRLERVLSKHPLVHKLWQKEQGYIFRVGAARQIFLSGAPEANIVGATASVLLQVDEAQDVAIDKFDKDINPMAASTNATRVFWGTAWSEETLLARELYSARHIEELDGQQRCFVISADEVSREVPAYGEFVRQQIERLGRDHPMVRTQYFSEMMEHAGGLFNEGRLALMKGQHLSEHAPQPGGRYALLLDVAGEDAGLSAGSGLSHPGRDATALTVVAIYPFENTAWGGGQVGYRVVARKAWVGVSHSRLFDELLVLARHWRAIKLVVDATGVGAGIANFLERALPGRVIAFQFTASSKSRLGWDFLALIDSGRYQEHSDSNNEQQQFFKEARACKYSVSPGPERRLQWQVPPGTRDQHGQELHDDWLMSAALCSALEDEFPGGGSPTRIVRAQDPLKLIDREDRRMDW
jgi:hypothetical protein